MRNLYLALLKYKDHLIFLIAVTLSFSLLLKNDTPDVLIVRGKFSDYFSFISSPFAWVKSMTQLQGETQLLRDKNIQLTLEMEAMLIAQGENNELRDLLGFKRESKLKLLAARVINMGASSNLTSITLDIGSDHGVMVNQPVLVPEGVIGKTVVVGEKSATVQIIKDGNYRLSVRIMPSGNAGILQYIAQDYCEVRELQKNSTISVGDKVVTSGFSQIYPENLPVGEVIEVVDERGSFQTVAKVRIRPNLGALLNVFIVIEEIDEVD
ncbi:MAG: rod shape-determining protein MreC [Candidatus Marinimicrobia bacterium]|nr:rod shape-determining protein MreC [Candidatus Neomarinimicrobiota bacterium]MBL7010059.1 rod shape-determining protein MreC [Candidatus Neomarinimicrobiota bacterium]MBL7030328.1 rod shape-determining protein MreC [Candidatus Neomarinimicrobiota bacterium]